MAKILLVEDEEYLVELYEELLRGEGYEVDKAIDGEQALALMKKGGYDLVLLDLIIPKISGKEVLERLKKDKPENGNKAVVFMTNLGKEAFDGVGGKHGVNGVIVKSDVNPDEFITQVKKYLTTNDK